MRTIFGVIFIHNVKKGLRKNFVLVSPPENLRSLPNQISRGHKIYAGKYSKLTLYGRQTITLINKNSTPAALRSSAGAALLEDYRSTTTRSRSLSSPLPDLADLSRNYSKRPTQSVPMPKRCNSEKTVATAKQ